MVTSMPTDVPSDPVSMESPEYTANWWSAAMVAGCAENADTADVGLYDDNYLANMYDDYDLSMSDV
jgi:hypothetical protein